MLVFFDCEFTGLHQRTTLISIGLVAENGQQFYAELTDYDAKQVDSWQIEHVFGKLWQGSNVPPDVTYVYGDKKQVADALRGWLRDLFVPTVTMVGDVLFFDWLLFCDLFGGVLQIPSQVYYIPFDLATMLYWEGYDPDFNRETFAGLIFGGKPHNALWDAQVIRACYNRLRTSKKGG